MPFSARVVGMFDMTVERESESVTLHCTTSGAAPIFLRSCMKLEASGFVAPERERNVRC